MVENANVDIIFSVPFVYSFKGKSQDITKEEKKEKKKNRNHV